MIAITLPAPTTVPQRFLARFDLLLDEIHAPVIGRRVPGTLPVALVAFLASLGASAYFVSTGLSMA